MVIAADLALALDPVALARRTGLEPDPWQQHVLRSTAPRLLLNCCRQSGKSTVAGVGAIHTALYEPGSLTLLLSPSLRQSQELFRKTTELLDQLDRPEPVQGESTLQLQLANGSRIVSLPGKEATIRGYSGVRRLIIDEASRVSDELYASVRPMLAVSGGTLLAISTPWGKRGWWYREWSDGGPGWDRTRVTAHECPRIPAAFLEEEQRALGTWWFNQEYLCLFEDNVSQVFPTDLVLGAGRDDVELLFGDSAPAAESPGASDDVELLFGELS